MFHGSAEFNLTVRALGQRFFLTFYASSVTGKTVLGGKTEMFFFLLFCYLFYCSCCFCCFFFLLLLLFLFLLFWEGGNVFQVYVKSLL